MEASFETRNTRRSATNLQHLTLAPLSSRLPIDADLDDFDIDESGVLSWQRSSYIQGKSAPTTPRILSRSSSRHRSTARDVTAAKGSKSFPHIVGLQQQNVEGLYGGVRDLNPQHKPRYTTNVLKRKGNKPSKEGKRSSEDGEWLFRAGIAISSEARETKGQSWLVSRESSTSLVAQADADGAAGSYISGRTMSGLDMTGYAHSSEPSLHGNRVSRTSSRPGSKPGSARPSRCSSRVRSRIELTYLTTTSAGDGLATSGARTPASSHPAPRSSIDLDEEREIDDYFSAITTSATNPIARRDPRLLGPDFIDSNEVYSGDGGEDVEQVEDEHETDAEIAELAKRDRGFGLGGVVDRMMNWTLFNVKEDGLIDSDADIEYEDETPMQSVRRQVIIPALKPAPVADTRKESEAKGEEEGGWKDAAWLLSVASKVLL